jgi:hypothetical protein
MASKYWIKFYIEALDDPKVARLPDNLWRRYYECCLLAGEVDDEGRLPSINNVAWRFRVDEETVTTEFDQLARQGLLDYRVQNVLETDCWFVTNYAKRQAAITGAQRVARHRETKKKRNYYETGNAPVTNRYTEVEVDIDIDIDVEEDTSPPTSKFSHLSVFFVNMTSIPELTGGAERWNEAIQTWLDAGLEECDLREAHKILRSKSYTVIGPWSLTNTAIGEMSKRKNKAPLEIPAARY